MTVPVCPTHRIALVMVFDHIGRKTGFYCLVCRAEQGPKPW